MNRNHKMKRKMAGSLAVGLSVLLGAAPVYAAEGNGAEQADGSSLCKDETVYVNADASGAQEKVTVSNWLKNAGKVKNLKDESSLKDIKNIKGEETFTEEGKNLTWQTDGKDIYYQGTTDKELPVSVKLTYFLDGKELKPEELKGKSGHLKIKIDYKNNEKKTVEVNGKEEELYSPFVMMTGLIMPNETFSNVTIDNGKVISDGNRNVVLGFAMPGMKESLGIDAQEAEEGLTLPESLEISADVTDFTMSSTFTVALSDLLEDMNINEIGDFDELKDSLNDLEDAALKLVSGSAELSEGADTLGNSYEEFDAGLGALGEGIDVLYGGASSLSSGIEDYTSGADTLNAGIRQYLGNNGELTGKVTEYVDGVNTVVLGVEQYAKGAEELSDGVAAYVTGEQQLSEGASRLADLSDGLGAVQEAVEKLSAATDGKPDGTGSPSEGETQDIKTACEKLTEAVGNLNTMLNGNSAGTAGGADANTGQTGADIQYTDTFAEQIDALSAEGEKLASQTEELSGDVKNGLLAPLTELCDTLAALSEDMAGMNEAVENLDAKCAQQTEAVNQAIRSDNEKIAAAKAEAENSRNSIESSIQELEAQKFAAGDNTELAAQIQMAIDSLNGAKDAAEPLAGMEELETIAAPQSGEIDIPGLDSAVSEARAALDSFQETAGKIEEQIPALQEQMTAGENAADTVRKGSAEETRRKNEKDAQMELIKSAVAKINTGMQRLNGAVAGKGGLSDSIGALNESIMASFPEAIQGVEALQAGFAGLDAYNESLLDGVEALKESSPALIQGAGQLSGGTEELSSGLAKLGKQMSDGAAVLSANSGALRNGAASLVSGAEELAGGGEELQSGSTQVKDGITQLRSGALALKNGTEEFDREGTSRLKATVEEELGGILDRLDALASEKCGYDTYSGKADGMEGNVKFVIETEAIE